MIICLLQWLFQAKPQGSCRRPAPQAVVMRHEVNDPCRNRWLEALLRAFAVLWPC
jgi:hypothetical protein